MKIIWELTKVSPLRFNELQRRVGTISALALSKELKALEKIGLVSRIQYQEVPPHVEYRLTELGQKLEAPLKGLGDWGVALQEEEGLLKP